MISNQQMSVQGPLTRTVADAALALQIMAQGTPLDPQWVPARLEYPDTHRPLKVAMFKTHAAYDVDPTVTAAIEQAAQWLADAGCAIEEVEPPHFEEGAQLWRQMVMDDMRRGGQPAIKSMADHGTRNALHSYMAGVPALDRDQTLEAQVRRFNICRDWAVFLDKYPVLLMPNSWHRQFAIDFDQRGDDAVNRLLAAQAPLLGTAMMGLPGLSVPTGMSNGLPIGVQICTARFREDLALRAGAMIERAAGFSALDWLANRR